MLSQAMAAVEQPRQSLAISLSRGLVVIVAFVLLFAQLWGVTGVWMAFPGHGDPDVCAGAGHLFPFKRRRDALKQKQSAD